MQYALADIGISARTKSTIQFKLSDIRISNGRTMYWLEGIRVTAFRMRNIGA